MHVPVRRAAAPASALILFALLAGCANLDASAAAKSADASSAPPDWKCVPCITKTDCGAGFCVQFADDTFCAADCSTVGCGTGLHCATLPAENGEAVRACVPATDLCAPGVGDRAGTPTADVAGADAAPVPSACGALDGPDTDSCCQSCTPGGGKTCQTNHCYGGWFCNRDACKCQPAPAAGTCSADPIDASAGTPDIEATPDAVSGSDAGSTTQTNPAIGPAGGTLDSLVFGIVGDTRPPLPDDTAGYPTAIATKIWQRVGAANPPIVVTTGDYVFASTYGNEAAKQLDLYLQASSPYKGLRLPTLGNHECTGATASNCGSGTQSGITNNFQAFIDKMLTPLGLAQPWYTVQISATDKSWTAKFVVIAANAWNSQQAAWLDQELAKPTTYTFVVRHEPMETSNTPGVPPSNAIMAKHPMTILLCGHTHTYSYKPSSHEVVVGHGGAPLSGSTNYGYVMAHRRADGAIVFENFDYATGQAVSTFAVNADGTQAP